MMNVMIRGIIVGQNLKRVEWKAKSAVIIDCLESCQSEKNSSLTNAETRKLIGQQRTNRVRNESFNWMVVQSCESIGNINSVMTGVDCAYPKDIFNLAEFFSTRWKLYLR